MPTIREHFERIQERTHYSYFVVSDQSNEVEQLEQLFSQIDTIESLRLIMPRLTSFPKGLHRFTKMKNLSIDLPLVSQIESNDLPPNIQWFDIKSKSLIEIPRLLWGGKLNFIKLEIDKLINQDYGNEGIVSVEHIDFSIKNLKFLPRVIDYKKGSQLAIRSRDLTTLPENLISNSKLKSLSIKTHKLNTQLQLEKTNHLLTLSLETENPLDMSYARLPESLTKLYLKSPYTTLPDLSLASSLQELHVKGLVGDLDNGIEKNKQLKILNIYDSTLTGITTNINKLKGLEKIWITNSVDHLPAAILKQESLVELGLTKNKIPKINKDWSLLKNLKTLNLSSNGTEIESLDFISDLPMLESININDNRIQSKYLFITKKKVPLRRYNDFISLNTQIAEKEILSIGAALGKIKFSEETKRELFDSFWEKGSIHGAITADSTLLTAALNLQYSPSRNEAIRVLDEWIHEHNGSSTLRKGSVIYIEGKPKESVTKLKAIMKDHGYHYAAKLSAEVTHIIIGKNPKNPEALDKSKYLYLTEDVLQQIKSTQNPGFLEKKITEGEPQMVDKVKLLLENEQPVNVMIGLKMLEQGGIPEQLMETLLLLAKANAESKVRAKAKKLLQIHGPQSWRILLDNKLLFKNINKKVREQELNIKLKKIEASAGEDSAALLAITLYKHYGKGLRYVVLNKSLSDHWQKEMADALIKDGHFDYSRGLGYKNWKNVPLNELTLFPFKVKFPLPVSVLDYHTVESMNLHNTKLIGMPKGLTKFVDLKEIDLSFNFFKTLSPKIKALKNLEILDLSFNTFREFPTNITLLPNLKRVDLRHNRLNNGYNALVISDEVKLAMPNCEILVNPNDK